uniref:Uncharacterized protein n=1 Tax=Amazona collaria TaxID=241587 RepID=A0A8B9GGU0_9PSIT
EFLPQIQSKLPLFKFEPVTPCPLTTVPNEESLPSIPIGPLQILEGCYEVSTQPSLLQAEQPQLSHSIFIREVLQNESCWHAAYNKLRDQVEMLTRQNMELRDGLRVSDHQRCKEEKHPEAVNFMDRKSETPGEKCCYPLLTQDTASLGGIKCFRLQFKRQNSGLSGSFHLSVYSREKNMCL